MKKIISLSFLLAGSCFGQLVTTNIPTDMAWPAGKDHINRTINQIGSNVMVSGSAVGGDLYGTIANAQIGTGKVASLEILDYAITNMDIATNGVSSANIADDGIVNADINSAAAIASTKLNLSSVTIGSATVQTNLGVSGNANITGTLTNTGVIAANGGVNFNNQNASSVALLTCNNADFTGNARLLGTALLGDTSGDSILASGTVTFAQAPIFTTTLGAGTVVAAALNNLPANSSTVAIFRVEFIGTNRYVSPIYLSNP